MDRAGRRSAAADRAYYNYRLGLKQPRRWGWWCERQGFDFREFVFIR